jgi:pyruvate dehydrogenase E2 component (dihydrolipoamide acetyltransferase)
MNHDGLYEFRFPDIGEGIHEGRVLQWMRHPGDRVSQGEVLALVETDKVVAEMPSPKDGVLRELAVEEGQDIQVGQVLARLELSTQPAGPVEPSSGGEGGDPGAVVGRLEAGAGTVLPPSGEAGRRLEEATGRRKAIATPVARRLAAQLGVELASVQGSGPVGRVLKEDILAAVREGEEAARGRRPPEEGRAPDSGEPRRSSGIVGLSTLRRTLARNMEESWKIPAAVVHELTEVDGLASLREELNREAEAAGGRRLSFLPFFIKVAALSLKRFPLLNSWYHPAQEAFETPEAINIGFALDSDAGLVVPVVRAADTLSLEEIQEQLDYRRDEAARRRLDPSALSEGTFTITNYGTFGGLFGRPLILPPQVAILGIGRIHEAPVVRDGAVAPGKLLPLSLVFDHRLIDGAYAARFIRLYMSLVHAPHRLLVLMR